MVDQLDRAIERVEKVSSELDRSVSHLGTEFRILELSVDHLVEKYQGVAERLSQAEKRLRLVEQAIDRANIGHMTKRIEQLETRLQTVEKEGIGLNARQALIASILVMGGSAMVSAIIGKIVQLF